MNKRPRTQADFRFIEHLVRNGHPNPTIERLFNGEIEWRSGVVSLAGELHCADCFLPITLHECVHCGQTNYGERRQ